MMVEQHDSLSPVVDGRWLGCHRLIAVREGGPARAIHLILHLSVEIGAAIAGFGPAWNRGGPRLRHSATLRYGATMQLCAPSQPDPTYISGAMIVAGDVLDVVRCAGSKVRLPCQCHSASGPTAASAYSTRLLLLFATNPDK